MGSIQFLLEMRFVLGASIVSGARCKEEVLVLHGVCEHAVRTMLTIISIIVCVRCALPLSEGLMMLGIQDVCIVYILSLLCVLFRCVLCGDVGLHLFTALCVNAVQSCLI